jgi:hypothetical protein
LWRGGIAPQIFQISRSARLRACRTQAGQICRWCGSAGVGHSTRATHTPTCSVRGRHEARGERRWIRSTITGSYRTAAFVGMQAHSHRGRGREGVKAAAKVDCMCLRRIKAGVPDEEATGHYELSQTASAHFCGLSRPALCSAHADSTPRAVGDRCLACQPSPSAAPCGMAIGAPLASRRANGCRQAGDCLETRPRS